MKNTNLVHFLSLRMKAFFMIGIIATIAIGCGDDDGDTTPVTPEPDGPGTVLELAQATPELSTLATVLADYPDLVQLLSDDGTLTVLAPSNTAFDVLLTDLGLSLDEVDPNVMKTILENHVITTTAAESSTLTDGQTLTPAGGGSLTVGIDGTTVMVDDATVITPDVIGNNGVVHVIDQVLVPGTVVGAANIVTLAGKTEELSVLAGLLSIYPDLVTLLSDPGTNTVFAPTNAAFTALLEVLGQGADAPMILDDLSETVLERVLMYHVITSTALKAGDLSDGQEAETALSATDIVTVGVDGTNVTINGANVSTPDIVASNGIIHIVDQVLVPTQELSIVNTVLEPAYFNKNYSTLTAAVQAAGLVETLIDKSAEFTVFAPDNDAFDAAITALGTTAADLLANTELLTSILQYHVLDSEVKAEGLPMTGTDAVPFAAAIATLNGNFYLSNQGGDKDVFINGTTQVVATDLVQENGVVHAINGVLVPQTMDIVAVATAVGLTKLAEALTEAELVGTLQMDGPFTVFAPDNDAFDAAYSLLGVAGPDEIDDDLLKEVLLYHVLRGSIAFSTDLTDGAEPTTATTAGATVKVNLGTGVTLTDNSSATMDATVSSPNVFTKNGVVHIVDALMLPQELMP